MIEQIDGTSEELDALIHCLCSLEFAPEKASKIDYRQYIRHYISRRKQAVERGRLLARNADIVQAYSMGVSVPKLRQKYGLSNTTIYTILRAQA